MANTIWYKPSGDTLYLSNEQVDSSYRQTSGASSSATRSPFEPSAIGISTTAKHIVVVGDKLELMPNCKMLFYKFNVIETIDVSKFDTSNVTDMSSMFCGCSVLTNIVGLDKFDTSNVTTMRAMFSADYALPQVDVSSFNTSKVTDMYQMFGNCRALTSLDLSNFNTSNVTDMSYMFSSCNELVSLTGLENWDVSKVTTFQSAFTNFEKLEEIDLSGWSIDSCTNTRWMFQRCHKLSKIYASDWRGKKVTESLNMFNEDTLLPGFDSSKVDISMAYPYLGEGTLEGYFSEPSTKIKIEIKFDKNEFTYDSTEKEGTYSVIGDLQVGDVVSFTKTAETNVCDIVNKNLSDVKVMRGSVDVTEEYEVTITEGTFKINKANLSITSKENSWVYDNEEHYDDTKTVVGLGVNDTLNVTDSTKVKLVSDSNKDNELTYEIVRGGDDVSANYTITEVWKKLTITKRPLKVVSNNHSWVYDSTEKNDIGYTLVGTVANGDVISVVTDTKKTHVGTYENNLTYKIVEGVTDKVPNYELTYEYGELEITPRELIISSDSDTKKYDGTELTKNTYTISGLQVNDTFTPTFTGTITDVGIVDNTYTYVIGGIAVNGDYSPITENKGKLEITKRDITITSADDVKKYDGTPLTNASYTITGDGLATTDTLTVLTSASQTQIGQCPNVLTYDIKRGSVNTKGNYNITEKWGTLVVADIILEVDKTEIEVEVGKTYTVNVDWKYFTEASQITHYAVSGPSHSTIIGGTVQGDLKNGKKPFTITGVNVGKTVYEFKKINGSDVLTCQVVVHVIPTVTFPEFSAGNISMYVGDTTNLNVSITNAPSTYTTTFIIANPSIGTITKTNNLQAVINAMQQGSCDITVEIEYEEAE